MALATAAAVLAAGPFAEAPRAAEVTLFAAASTIGAVEDLAERYMARHAESGMRVRTVFAASSTLAKQIVQGAPADLFLSANPAWMDYLAERDAIDRESRHDLLGNRLVLIAPLGAAAQPLGAGFSIDALLGDKPLAIADPDHVPAGIYAEAALGATGLWRNVAGRAVRAGDVRAALALVDRSEAGAGVVYATDVLRSSKVAVVFEFPVDSHPQIVYPLAIVAGQDRPEVRSFYDYMRGPEAGETLRAHGFLLPSPEGP